MLPLIFGVNVICAEVSQNGCIVCDRRQRAAFEMPPTEELANCFLPVMGEIVTMTIGTDIVTEFSVTIVIVIITGK